MLQIEGIGWRTNGPHRQCKVCPKAVSVQDCSTTNSFQHLTNTTSQGGSSVALLAVHENERRWTCWYIYCYLSLLASVFVPVKADDETRKWFSVLVCCLMGVSFSLNLIGARLPIHSRMCKRRTICFAAQTQQKAAIKVNVQAHTRCSAGPFQRRVKTCCHSGSLFCSASRIAAAFAAIRIIWAGSQQCGNKVDPVDFQNNI